MRNSAVGKELTRELVTMEIGPNKQPCGIPLIPKQRMCLPCGGSFSYGATVLVGYCLYRISGYTSCYSLPQVLP